MLTFGGRPSPFKLYLNECGVSEFVTNQRDVRGGVAARSCRASAHIIFIRDDLKRLRMRV